MNNAPETMSQSFTSSSCVKSGRKLLQVFEHPPEQPFSQRSVAMLVGMGKVVATRSSGSAQGRKRAAVQSQRVTDVVEAAFSADIMPAAMSALASLKTRLVSGPSNWSIAIATHCDLPTSELVGTLGSRITAEHR